MSSLPLIRKLHFIILLLLGGTVLAAGDFSCGKDGTATAVFWRNAMLLEPWFAKADTTDDNLLNGKCELKQSALPDGRKAVNRIFRGAPSWRLEQVVSADGNEVEMTFGCGLEAFSDRAASYAFELRIPWKLVADKPYQMIRGMRNNVKRIHGVFSKDFKNISQVRFLALGDGKTSGPVLDLNPRGLTAYESDMYANATLRGQWSMRRNGDFLILSSTVPLSAFGGYYGAKFRFFTGTCDDYARRHARDRFTYLDPVSSRYILSFGSAKHGKMYQPADALPYTPERGFGWLDNFTPSLKTEAPEGAFYSHAEGSGKAVFQLGKLDNGLYMLTLGCGNLNSGKKKFGIRINGEERIRDFELSPGQAADLTIPVYIDSGNIRIEFSGEWLISMLNLQMLLNRYEDYAVRRGIWAVDDFEPMLGMSPNSAVKQPPVFPVGKGVYPLPVPGQEAAGIRKPFVRDSVKTRSEPWHYRLKIGSHGQNLSAMSALLPPDAAEKMVRFHVRKGKNFLIHNGIFSRHLYRTEAEKSEKIVLKRIADEAHKHGMHVLDHQDYGLLWDCGSGFRTLTEETPNLQHSIYNHGIHISICPSAADRRKKFFERTVKLIRETGIDALMLDEFGYFSSSGCCGCADCRKAFFKETNWYLPVNELSADLNNPQSRLWQCFLEFQRKKIGDFWVEFRRMVQKERPDFVFMSYCTHRYFVEGWTNLERLRSGVLYGTEIINQNVFNSGRTTFSYRKLKNIMFTCCGVPVMGLVYRGSVPGLGYFGWAMNNMNGQETWFLGSSEPKTDFNRFTENMDRAAARPIADIAVLFSRKSNSGNRKPNINSNSWLPGKLMGLAQTLDAMHQAYIFIDESFLTAEKLASYPVLMLPAAPVLTESEIRILKDYVRNGGKLLITSRTGTLDEDRNSRKWPFSDWFGTSPAKLGMGSDLIYKGKKLHFRKPFYFQHPIGKPAAGCVTLVSYANANAPLAVKRKVGKGEVLWLNGEFTRALYQEEWFHPGDRYDFVLDPLQNAMVQDLLKDLIGDKASFKVDAPEKVYTSFYREGDTALIHFLNHTGFRFKLGDKMPWDVAKDAFPPPSKPITAKVRTDRKISEVYAVSPDFEGRKKIPFTQQDRVVKFALPPDLLKVYTIVKLR